MKTRDYEQQIAENIRGLPQRTLAEVADFVDFLKARARSRGKLHAHLARLSRDQEAHLEEEFRDYDRLYPRE
ncbi:MAG: hypothetical protein FJ291_03985 [Planctomycetes bacterium]|nr:hypothetical protein [Planctomycetota bacterium]